MEHGLGQPSGIGVVARAMIAVEERDTVVKVMFGAMGEGESRPLFAIGADHILMGHATKRDDDLKVGEGGQTGLEKPTAHFGLGACGLVLWRDATHDIGDHAVDKFQTVIGPRVIGAFGKAELQERWVEKVTRPIACKGAPRPIGSLKAWRQTHHEKSYLVRPKGGHRRVEPIRMSLLICRSEIHKSRAQGAIEGGFGCVGRVHGCHKRFHAGTGRDPSDRPGTNLRQALAMQSCAVLVRESEMILVALGANLPGPWGPPRQGLEAALGQFPTYGLQVEALSSFYRTPAVTPYAQPDFVNAVVRIATALDPSELLKQLHRIEAAFGRVRSQRWEERTLDLDLIDYNGLIQRETAENSLILPHPRAAERAFVLGPLCDVAPEWRHPVLSASASDLLAALPAADRGGLVKLDTASKA